MEAITEKLKPQDWEVRKGVNPDIVVAKKISIDNILPIFAFSVLFLFIIGMVLLFSLGLNAYFFIGLLAFSVISLLLIAVVSYVFGNGSDGLPLLNSEKTSPLITIEDIESRTSYPSLNNSDHMYGGGGIMDNYFDH